MQEFTFNGDWEFILNLPLFFKSNLNYRENMNEIYAKPNIKIKDFKNYDPDPLSEQINTLNFIIKNEQTILESVCKALEIINKDYGDRCGEYDWFPDDLNSKNLGQVLIVQEIAILTEHKNDFAYYEMSCGYKGDEEHGLMIVFHQENLIEYAAIGEIEYSNLYKDLGDRAQSFIDNNIKNRDFGENQIHQVLPKYGKFKPWQLEATAEHINNLMRKNKTEKLIEIVESGAFDVNLRFDYKERNLVDLAANFNNVELLNYYINKGGDFSKSMLNCSDFYFRKEAIECLVNHGASIDILNAWGVTALHNAIATLARVMMSGEAFHEDERRSKRAQDQIVLEKDKIKYYLSMGANPNSLNKNGDDYKTLLKNRRVNDVVFNEITQLIEPQNDKKSIWKFWKLG